MPPKTIFAIALSFSLVLCPLLFVNLANGYPSWTDFSYTDWNAGTYPAIFGNSGNRHYDNRLAWDGTKFITIQGQYYTAINSLWSVSSFKCQTDWDTPVALDIPRTWDIGHHALCNNPDGFPPTDVAWADQSHNVKFKLWYAAYGDNNHFRYSESTDGLYWTPFFLEYAYCPPTYKVAPNKNMIKPDVLYRPEGSPSLDSVNPMDNRYICYLGAFDTGGGPSYFE
ncbi:MAG: hypothetical protein NTV79_07915, partial [Candidatus Aureabacteria bacterium]|nr:hypothetical protein [Candidatus Auribacterota bacterium]